MRELVLTQLATESNVKHDSTVDMTIPVHLYSEKTPQTLYRLHLISHRWYQKDQPIPHRARSNLVNLPTAHK